MRDMIAAYAGIALNARKQSMVYNRLVRRLRATGHASFRAYLDWVESPGSDERQSFVNALTTNLTALFREAHHFDMLAAHAVARRARPYRVWSSACSSGEEAWSAAIALHERGCPAKILATDVDTEVLAVARAAAYRVEALERAGRERLRRHFLRGTGPNAGLALVRPELRAMVRFAARNLLAPEWPAQERFDALFCRNVLIYFDRPTQLRLLDRFAGVLAPGALLFLGHSENCATGHGAFRACGRTAYERR